MYRLIRRYQIRDEIIFALISSEAMGHEDKPWFPKDPKERDPDEYWGDDYSTGYNYLLYGGGIFITVILVIMFVKMYVKLWVCCLERNKRHWLTILPRNVGCLSLPRQCFFCSALNLKSVIGPLVINITYQALSNSLLIAPR
ncbi:hypothetical protein NQ315_007268 [Exocentrus adspersus]|uniref:FXYD domain-containing ion transport regulator n=1 Tax=Exocentrus adspersus TaxID=1586481 RepID=A0AAV8WDZ3_9CUCU|nr:hypothetical protein NQ315_007268 [Exocentrus adspersus]